MNCNDMAMDVCGCLVGFKVCRDEV
jgi:hypothetical protein